MSTVTFDNIIYTLNNNNTAIVSGNTLDSSTNVVIPSSINASGISYSVTIIGNNAFKESSYLTSIIIPNSVTTIQDGNYLNSGAFYKCTNLTSVTFDPSSSLHTIGEATFTECTSLTSITIPNSVTNIKSDVFFDCTNLSSVTFEANSNLEIIGSYAFSGTGLISFTIPISVTSITSHSFHNCSSLYSITIPNSVTSIGNHAFEGCSSLNSIVIPDSVTSIEEFVFKSCPNLINVVIDDQSRITTVYTSSFTDVSSNPSSSITFYNTDVSSGLVGNWQTIATYYATQIYPNSGNETVIHNSTEFSNFLNSTSSIYGYITENIEINYDLTSAIPKIITGNNIRITRTGEAISFSPLPPPSIASGFSNL